jgi:hypothetical protein
MNIDDLLRVLLWGWADVGVVLVLGPMLMFGRIRVRVSYTFHEYTDDPTATLHPAVAKSVADWQRWRFQPLGTIRQFVWFGSLAEWRRVFRSECLQTADATEYVTLERLYDSEVVSYTLSTTTTRGGLVQTMQPAELLTTDEPLFARQEYERHSPEDLLVCHREFTNQFLQRRNLARQPVTLAELVSTIAERERDLRDAYYRLGNNGKFNSVLGCVLVGLFLSTSGCAWLVGWCFLPFLSVFERIAFCLGIGALFHLAFVYRMRSGVNVTFEDDTEDLVEDWEIDSTDEKPKNSERPSD